MKKLVIVFAIAAMIITSCQRKETSPSIITTADMPTIEILVNFVSVSVPVSQRADYFQDTNDSGKIIKAVIGYNEKGVFDANLLNRLSDDKWKERIKLLNDALK